MGWHMKFVICVQLAYVSVCLTREMSVVREWTSLDVLTSKDGQESRRSMGVPIKIKSWLMYKDRVFVTLHGEREYSLAYFDLTDNSTSPLLRPYLSNENQQNIYKPYKLHIDRCDRLWVEYFPEMDYPTEFYIIVIDLNTDSILKNITIEAGLEFTYHMTFDDFDCDNEYVYIPSYGGVWTYSWADGYLWRNTSTGTGTIISMIVAPNSIVYYNVRHESMVYYMSTTHLRDKSNKTIDIRGLSRSRKLNVNLDSSALDAKSDVLYYFKDQKTLHAVPCWTSERCSSNCQDVSFDPIDNGWLLNYLRYITVDKNGYLWAFAIIFDGGKIKLRLSSVDVKSLCI